MCLSEIKFTCCNCPGDILRDLRSDSVPADVTTCRVVPVRDVPDILSPHLLRGAERGAGRRSRHERTG